MDGQIIKDNIYIYKDENYLKFEKPIFFIKQSKENGHIFIYSEKKICHCSPPNINKYLEMDEIERTNKFYIKDQREDLFY